MSERERERERERGREREREREGEGERERERGGGERERERAVELAETATVRQLTASISHFVKMNLARINFNGMRKTMTRG